LRALVAESTGGIVCECPQTWLLYVAWGTLEAGWDDLAVVGEVDEFGRGGFGFVVKQVDRRLRGRLTTLRRWGRVGGNGLVLIGKSRCSCRLLELCE
jgi:hypothetical protein